MSAQEFVRFTVTPPQGARTEEQPTQKAFRRSSYQRPALTVLGTVTRMVQSGPIGNRNETYQGRYWSDR
jgi:hypothetical protein